MTDRWANSPFIDLTPPEYARTEFRGVVHLVSGWVTFNTKTRDGGESGPCEIALCNLFKSYGPARPRCEGLVTCVACLAELFKQPRAIVT